MGDHGITLPKNLMALFCGRHPRLSCCHNVQLAGTGHLADTAICRQRMLTEEILHRFDMVLGLLWSIACLTLTWVWDRKCVIFGLKSVKNWLICSDSHNVHIITTEPTWLYSIVRRSVLNGQMWHGKLFICYRAFMIYVLSFTKK
jgi:hypothetical protein